MSSSLIGLSVASSVVKGRAFASLVDGFLGAIVVFRMFVLCVFCEGSFYSERLSRTPELGKGKVCSLVCCCNKTNVVVGLVGYP